jgi:hypothetical protein
MRYSAMSMATSVGGSERPMRTDRSSRPAWLSGRSGPSKSPGSYPLVRS